MPPEAIYVLDRAYVDSELVYIWREVHSGKREPAVGLASLEEAEKYARENFYPNYPISEERRYRELDRRSGEDRRQRYNGHPDRRIAPEGRRVDDQLKRYKP